MVSSYEETRQMLNAIKVDQKPCVAIFYSQAMCYGFLEGYFNGYYVSIVAALFRTYKMA